MLSVITPYKTGARFLPDYAKSLAAQHMDLEIIFLYSGDCEPWEDSPDLKKLRDTPGISFVPVCTGDQSLAAARTTGIQKASSDTVYFMDADDYLVDDALQTLVHTFEDQRADYVVGHRVSSSYHSPVFDNEGREDTGINVLPAPTGALLKDPVTVYTDNPGLLASDLKANGCGYDSDVYMELMGKRRTFRDVTLCHVMMRRDTALELSFYGASDQYCELMATAELLRDSTLKGVHEPGSVYVKLTHNDPVHFPSLSQKRGETDIEERLEACERTFEKVRDFNEGCPAVSGLSDLLVNDYLYCFAPCYWKDPEHIYSDYRFDRYSSLACKMPEWFVKRLRGVRKQFISMLLDTDITGSRRAYHRRFLVDKLKTTPRGKRWQAFTVFIYRKVFLKRPVRDNWVVVESFRGRYYNDSPRYIYEYLNKNYPGKYHFVWAFKKDRLREGRRELPGPGKAVRYLGLKHMYALAVSRFYVSNVRQPNFYKKRKGMVFLETWHGTPLKRLVFDQEEVTSADPLYKLRFYKSSQEWDYLVSPNEFSTKTFASCFDVPEDRIVTCGYPRNDILYTKNNPEDIAAIKEKLGIPADKKVILYAPTWRDDEYITSGEYRFELKLDLNAMRQALGDEYVVLLRMHYYIASHLDTEAYGGFAINVSSYNDISELYLVSDLLITDYSSVFFDYGNLKRPELFFTYDLEKYRDVLRGFYLDIEKDVPGPLLFTTDQVIEAVKNIDDINEKYRERYDRFYRRFCSVDDGHASERICELTFNNNDWRKNS